MIRYRDIELLIDLHNLESLGLRKCEVRKKEDISKTKGI